MLAHGRFYNLCVGCEFFWLPALVNFLLDSLGIIGGDTERFDKVMARHGKSGDTLRVKLFGWLFVPLGWMVAAYLLTERTGCEALVHLASC